MNAPDKLNDQVVDLYAHIVHQPEVKIEPSTLPTAHCRWSQGGNARQGESNAQWVLQPRAACVISQDPVPASPAFPQDPKTNLSYETMLSFYYHQGAQLLSICSQTRTIISPSWRVKPVCTSVQHLFRCKQSSDAYLQFICLFSILCSLVYFLSCLFVCLAVCLLNGWLVYFL